MEYEAGAKSSLEEVSFSAVLWNRIEGISGIVLDLTLETYDPRNKTHRSRNYNDHLSTVRAGSRSRYQMKSLMGGGEVGSESDISSFGNSLADLILRQCRHGGYTRLDSTSLPLRFRGITI